MDSHLIPEFNEIIKSLGRLVFVSLILLLETSLYLDGPRSWVVNSSTDRKKYCKDCVLEGQKFYFYR